MEDTLTALYQSITTLLPNSRGRTIQFMGSHQGEGTSVLIREFAKVAAVTLNKRVFLLDADHKNPVQARSFDVQPKYSWEDLAKNGVPFEYALCQVGKSPLFLTQVSQNGHSTLQPFDSPQADALLDRLRDEFDLILIDSAPPSSCPESLVLAGKVDGVVLVVEAEKTRWQVAERLKETIQEQGGNVLGVVLNKRRYSIPTIIYNRI